MLQVRTAKASHHDAAQSDFAQIFAYLAFVNGRYGILWLVQESVCAIKFLHLGMR